MHNKYLQILKDQNYWAFSQWTNYSISAIRVDWMGGTMTHVSWHPAMVSGEWGGFDDYSYFNSFCKSIPGSPFAAHELT